MEEDKGPEIYRRELTEPQQRVLLDAFETLRSIQSIADASRLRQAQRALNARLYTRFGLGKKDKETREIKPPSSARMLYWGLNRLGVPIGDKVEIISGVAEDVERSYERATRDYVVVPETFMRFAAHMWVYAGLAGAAVDKFKGKMS